jgi:hypothetical protein
VVPVVKRTRYLWYSPQQESNPLLKKGAGVAENNADAVVEQNALRYWCNRLRNNRWCTQQQQVVLVN